MMRVSGKLKNFSCWRIIYAGLAFAALGIMLHLSGARDFLSTAFTAPLQTLSFSLLPTLLFWGGMALAATGIGVFFLSLKFGNTYSLAQRDYAKEEETWIFL